ncbi:LamG domain-containing protein [Candidatus Poribacteria bacterium]|nr:LamG domain-containing protein [Candidatus Poribacteria bacterium]
MKNIVLTVLMVSMIMFPLLGEAINDNSLVLYLSFEENQGDKTKDQSETGTTGSLKNDVKWTKDGKYGNALSFAGANQYVEVPNVPQLDITKEITMEAWIYPIEVQGDSSLYGRRNSANQGGYCMQWTAGKIETWIHIGGWQGTRGKQTVTPKTGMWHHVAGVYDGKKVIQYVNGELDIEFALSGAMNNVAEVFRVGQAQTSLTPMHGTIDEVTIYNRALTQKEIQEDMNGVLLAVSPSGKLTTTWAAVKGE